MHIYDESGRPRFYFSDKAVYEHGSGRLIAVDPHVPRGPNNGLPAHWHEISGSRMVSLNDQQLATITQAASLLPVEKRSQFLERVAAMLKLRGRVADDDVRQVAELALCGLIQQPAA